MKTTIGKRIAENRKRLKLTQDALAEQLGVTAQAVSKWENDQSCPDISILPQLSDIFGITTDELLGKEPPAREAEVITEQESDSDKKTNYEFRWQAGRKNSLLFALGVLLFGGLLLAARILNWDVTWWEILWPTALLTFGIQKVIPRFSFIGLGCTVFGGYFLVSNLKLFDIPFGNELIFPVIVLVFGLSLVADAFRKPKKSGFHIHKNGKEYSSINEITTDKCDITENSFDCELNFGHGYHEIFSEQLQHGDITCVFGELTVDLSGCRAVSENCVIDAECNFGHLKLLVPNRFLIEADSDSTFAKLNIQGQPDEFPAGNIHLDADISFGNIEIQYI